MGKATSRVLGLGNATAVAAVKLVGCNVIYSATRTVQYPRIVLHKLFKRDCST